MSLNGQSALISFLRQKGKIYISAVVLGLNDALIELVGALAGFTMVLPDNRTIVMAGLTTGVAATLSMAASEYLSQEADSRSTRPWMAACLTGITYLLTVFALLLPFFIFKTPLVSLFACIFCAALLILAFTFLEARLRRQSFHRLCLQMLSISFGVAILSFSLSWAVESLWGIEIH